MDVKMNFEKWKKIILFSLLAFVLGTIFLNIFWYLSV